MRLTLSRIPPSCKVILLFLLVFSWFFSTKWYCPAQLEITGSSPGKDGLLEVSWDSGAGNNGYELRRFLLNTATLENQEKHSIAIRYAGEKHPASLPAEVVCRRIIIDNKEFDISATTVRGEKISDGHAIRLSQPGNEIILDVKADESIEIEMDTNNQSGKVEIIINGQSRIFDLYVANVEAKTLTFRYWVVGPEGGFRVRMAMPRYHVKTLTVTNGNPATEMFVDEIRVDAGTSQRTLFSGSQEKLDKKSFRRVSVLQKRYFHSTQIFLQILFAALTTWILTTCWRIYSHCRITGGVFSAKRRIFWYFFLISFTAFAPWLFAFWPGVMSVDSLKIWRAAILPEIFLNDHPLLNVIFYRYLAGIWNNIAVVPVFHITMMSGLLAYIYYAIYRRGVSLKLLVPFYLLVVTAVPVGLYNVVLWKDIPFALLIVFFAFLLGDFYRRRQEGSFSLTKEQIFALFLLLLALAFTRHNGLVYLAVVPIYLVLLRLIPLKMVFYAVSAGAAVVGVAVLLLTSDKLMTNGDYLFSQGASFLKSLLEKSISDVADLTWRHYWGIFNINQKESAWDLWHYFLNDRFSYSFLLHAGWNDVYKYLADGSIFPRLTDIAMKVYWKSYEVPFVYFSWNPVHFLGLYLLVIVFFRKFPQAAIFGSFILVQVLSLLVFIDVMNWRYYYFAFLGGYLLIPLMLLDIQQRKGIKPEIGVQNAL